MAGIPIVGPGEHNHGPLSEKNPNIGATTHSKSTQKSHSKRSESTKSNAGRSKKQSSDLKAADLSSVHLDGEEDENVPIYATAGDVRKQVKLHLSQSKTAKAALARELNELMPSSKIDARGLDRFLKASGPKSAAHNPVFYAAYVLFEKKRIQDKKPKSKRREEMEEVWKKKGGFPRDSNMWVTCPKGSGPSLDSYGRMYIVDGKTGKTIY